MKTLNPGTRVEIKTGLFKGRQGVIQHSRLIGEEVADELYVHSVMIDDHDVPVSFTHHSLKVAKNSNKEAVVTDVSIPSEQDVAAYDILSQVHPDDITHLMYTNSVPS